MPPATSTPEERSAIDIRRTDPPPRPRFPAVAFDYRSVLVALMVSALQRCRRSRSMGLCIGAHSFITLCRRKHFL
jgi:hypothetical protein